MRVVGGDGSDTSLRSALEKLYKMEFDSPYFKIEGMAAQKNGRLLLGIRSVGKSNMDYKDVAHLISVGFKTDLQGNPFLVENDLKFEVDFTERVRTFFGREFGLTDLFVDHRDGILWLLVVHESEKDGNMTNDGRGNRLISWHRPSIR